jgi:hypothetical protein
MKLEIKEGSENYACQVIKLPVKQAVAGLDKLMKVTYQGNDILVSKDTSEEGLYLFFPVECAIHTDYLKANNEFRDATLNRDTDKKGYFETTGRVKAIKFKGVISTGYIAPIESLQPLLDIKGFKVGDEFTTINGYDLVKKYRVTRMQGQGGDPKESRYNKKLKAFNKLIPNQFRFHISTPPLAKCISHIKSDDTIVITDKWHGTSAVFSNVLIKKKLTWKDRLAKWFGIEVVESKYDNLYSSRSVIKNQYINEAVQSGYYNEDIWGTVNKELEGKIEQGVTIYGEIVGYLSSGRAIQKGYDYGCSQGMVGPDNNITATNTDNPEHKFVVYRITYTKPDGNVIEFSWNQVKEYCKKYNLETVIEIFNGPATWFLDETQEEGYAERFLEVLTENFLEGDCKFCKNKVPAEGIVLRRDNNTTAFDVYKLKSKRFILGETKAADAGETNIEDEESVDTTAVTA